MVGIPTVLITLIPENSLAAGPPRAFHPKGFKLGNCLGGPFDVALQGKVLRDALRRWEAREEPGHLWEQEYPEYVGQDDSWKKAMEEG
jgi:D-proline reductase (dithiol) PrdB